MPVFVCVCVFVCTSSSVDLLLYLANKFPFCVHNFLQRFIDIQWIFWNYIKWVYLINLSQQWRDNWNVSFSWRALLGGEWGRHSASTPLQSKLHRIISFLLEFGGQFVCSEPHELKEWVQLGDYANWMRAAHRIDQALVSMRVMPDVQRENHDWNEWWHERPRNVVTVSPSNNICYADNCNICG